MKFSTFLGATVVLLSGSAFARRGAVRPGSNALDTQDQTPPQVDAATTGRSGYNKISGNGNRNGALGRGRRGGRRGGRQGGRRGGRRGHRGGKRDLLYQRRVSPDKKGAKGITGLKGKPKPKPKLNHKPVNGIEGKGKLNRPGSSGGAYGTCKKNTQRCTNRELTIDSQCADDLKCLTDGATCGTHWQYPGQANCQL